MKIKEAILCAAAVVAIVANGGDKVIKNGDTLVFMGDSITQYGKDSAAGYLPLVAKGLATNGVNVTWICAGIAGNTAANMRARFQNDVIAKNPNVVTILAGVNDCAQGWPNNSASSPDDVAAMADMAIQAGIKPVLFSPTGSSLESFPQSITDYAAAVKNIAQARNIPYGTTHEAFRAYIENPVNPVIGKTDKGFPIRATIDSLHMDVVGNRIIAIEMLKALGFDSTDELNKAAAAWNEIAPFYLARPSVKITAAEYNAVKAAAWNAGKSVAEYHKELFLHGIELMRQNPSEMSSTAGASVEFSVGTLVGFPAYDAALDCGRALRQNETDIRSEVGSLSNVLNYAVLAAIHELPAVAEANMPTEPVQVVTTSVFSKQVEFTVSGYTGASTLSDFPVAVRIAAGSPSGFNYSDMANSSNGGELRFADASGRSLSYEIESWNPNGTSLLWVKLPALSQGAKFKMYYGGTPADNVQSRWTWKADYVGVWHMSEDGGSVFDSANGMEAVPKGNSASRQSATDGVFGKGRVNGVPGLNAYSGQSMLEVSDLTLLDVGDDFTFSGWVKMTASTPGDGIARIASRNRYVAAVYDTPDWQLAITGDSTLNGYSGSKTAVSGTIPSAMNTWVHVAGVFNGTTFTAYANGEKVFEQTITAVQDTNNKLVFGAYDKDCWQGHFIGNFDEFRLRDAVSSADWVKAEYAQSSASFLVAGAATDVQGGGIEPPAAKPSVVFCVD